MLPGSSGCKVRRLSSGTGTRPINGMYGTVRDTSSLAPSRFTPSLRRGIETQCHMS